MALEVPVSRVEQVKSAQLEPGASIVRSGGEIPAQQVDGHLALAAPFQCGRPGRDVGIYCRLGREPGGRDRANSNEHGNGAAEHAAERLVDCGSGLHQKGLTHV